MHSILRNIIFLLFSLAICQLSDAQVGVFKGLTADDGLSQVHINDMLQTSDGYLWIATKDGLNRYDGSEFRIFKNNEADPFSIQHDAVRYLFEDSRGLLWIAARGEYGINVYDPITERFYSLQTSEFYTDIDIASLWPFSAMGEDKNGDIWLGTFGGKILKLQLPEDFIGVIEKREITSSSLSIRDLIIGEYQLPEIDYEDAAVKKQDFVNHFYLTQDGRFTYGTLSKIVEIDEAGDMQTRGTFPFSIDDYDGFTTASEDNNGTLWYANEGRISLVRIDDRKVREYIIGTDDNIGLCRVASDEFGNFYIGGSKGVYSISAASIAAGDPQLSMINNEKFNAQRPMFVDRSNVLWVFHPARGMAKFTPLQEKFETVLKGGSIYRVFPNLDGSDIYVSKRDPCLINDEVIIETGDLNISHYHNVYYESASNLLWSIQRNFNNQVGTFLVRENLKSKGVLWNKVDLEEHHIHTFLRDKNDHLWLGLNQGGIALIDEEALSLKKFENEKFNTGTPQKHQTIYLYQDITGSIYSCTQNGLVRIEVNDTDSVHTFEIFRNTEGDSASLSSSNLLSVLDDPIEPHKYIWVGSKGRGLNKMNKQTGECTHIGLEDGLPDDVIYGIIDDDEGYLWLSTNKGIVRLNPGNKEIKVFSKSDGLQDLEFNTGSFAKLNNGKLAFGGVQGLNIFDPNTIKFNTHEPPIVITSLKVNNKEYQYRLKNETPNVDNAQKGNLSSTYENITLRHDQNFISLRFAALDFMNPEQNRYKYILSGHDDQWIGLGNVNFALYSKLPPGHYTFKVTGSNNDGLWASKPASINIIIQPPWWKTNLSYILYMMALGGGVICLYWFQLKRAKLHNSLLFEKKEKERLKELDTIKTTFFSNITHEFRTPLTLILEPARQLLKENTNEGTRQNLRLITGSANRLMNLINQLLEMAKMEAGKLTLSLQRAEMGEIIEPIIKQFTPLLQQKGINLHFEIDKYIGPVMLDVEKINNIIYNLLSNALKYTERGDIKVYIKSQIDKLNNTSKEYLLIKVEDSGIGIPQDQIPHIFDRFYQVDASSTRASGGTGIGLALIKEYVDLLAGEIRVESELHKGSSFIIKIPLTKAEGQRFTAMDQAHSQQDNFAKAPATQVHSSSEVLSSLHLENSPSLDSPEKGQEIILLVEDNDELRHFLQQSLLGAYQVFQAKNGKEGLKIARDIIPDLIVSDVMMPLMDGVEMSYAIRKDQLTSHIPIILLTAKTAIDSKIEGLESGVDAYLTKPFHLEELHIRIQKLIELRALLHRKYSSRIEIKKLKEESSYSPIDQQFLQNLSEIVISESMQIDFSVEILANKLFMSRSQLFRKMKALLGVSPNEFIRNYRLDLAKKILSESEVSIYEVARVVGFKDEKYFSTRFKERFNVSPSHLVEN